jgi:hypothetical protein
MKRGVLIRVEAAAKHKIAHGPERGDSLDAQ